MLVKNNNKLIYFTHGFIFNLFYKSYFVFREFLTVQEISSDECQIGKSKVFLRNKAHEPLEDKRKVMLHLMAKTIQRTWKGYFARKGITIKLLVLFNKLNYSKYIHRIENIPNPRISQYYKVLNFGLYNNVFRLHQNKVCCNNYTNRI